MNNEQTPPGIIRVQHQNKNDLEGKIKPVIDNFWDLYCEELGCQILEIEVEGIRYSVGDEMTWFGSPCHKITGFKWDGFKWTASSEGPGFIWNVSGLTHLPAKDQPSHAHERVGERDQYTKGYMQGISDMVNKPKDQKIESLQAEIQRLQSRITSLEDVLNELIIWDVSWKYDEHGAAYELGKIINKAKQASFTDKPVKS